MEDQVFFKLIEQWINVPYLVSFILFSYGFIKMAKIDKLTMNLFNKEFIIYKTYIVLLIAFLIAIPFYIMSDEENGITFMKLIMTYGIGTSFYELLVKRIERIFNKKSKLK